MSITNKYQNSGSELGINLNKGYFYDVTPQVKNITNMNLLYSNRLFDDKLAIDVNPNDREILYISDTTIPQSMMANFVGKDGFDNNLFYRYHFKQPGKQVFQNIMPCGWTFETVMNFDNKDMTDFSVFYYLGVGFEKELIDGELVDTSRSYEKDYLHNNIAFGFDKNKSIVVRSARYTEECYGCDEEEKNYSSTACGGDSSVTVTSGNLVTGSTLYEHSFDKAICSDDNTNFLVTVKFERDSSIINNMCTELGTKFVESESERIGTLKVYVNGLLYGSIYGFEDIVTRRASLPVHEFVQGWGFSDNFFISEDYNMFGTFEGKQPRGRFHSNPLSLSEIRHNYKQLKECYGIIGCFDLNCGPTFPEKVIEECPTSKADETTPISTTTTTEEITTTTSTTEEVTTTTTEDVTTTTTTEDVTTTTSTTEEVTTTTTTASPSLYTISNISLFNFNNPDIKDEFANNNHSTYKVFNIFTEQTNGVLHTSHLQELMDAAYDDYNNENYIQNPPLRIEGFANVIKYYGYGEVQVGDQLYTNQDVPYFTSGAAYITTGSNMSASDIILEFRDIQLNAGTARFIGWNDSGIVTSIEDITPVPKNTTEPAICNPFEVNGYYPLYLTQDCAERHIGGNGQFHTHDFGDPMVTYYMPNGLNMDPNNGSVTMWHGNYTTN